VVALLDAIVARGVGPTANRTLSILRKVYNWGISRELVEFSPCAQVPRPALEHERERFLSEHELRAFLLALPTIEDVPQTTKHAFKFQLATASRPGEAAGVSWQEIDLRAGVWTLPSERSKTHKSHTLPLSSFALNVLAEVRAIYPQSAWPFPSTDGPIRAATLATALRKNRAALGLERFTPHDLRRSAATQLAKLGNSRVVIASILGHSLPGQTSIYDRHSYQAEMRAALDQWGAVLERLSSPAEMKP
jgi:integrase